MSYRRVAGLLLLWSLVPMPFLYVVLPPFWLLTAVAAVLAVWRPQLVVRPSQATQNVLAVLIFGVVIAVGGLDVGPVRPLGHLLLLLTALSSLSVADRRSFLRFLPVLFTVWLAGVASSTHVSLALYLVVSAAVWWWTGMSVLLTGLEPDRAGAVRQLPQVRHVVVASLVVVLLATPIFVTMPRLSSPWVGGGRAHRTTGFSTSVELSRSSAIESSRELALTLRAPGGETIRPMWTRLRGTAFNMVFAGSWSPHTGGTTRPPQRFGRIWLDPERDDLDGTVELELELLRPGAYLFVPEGTVAVRAPVQLRMDAAGGLSLTERSSAPIEYTVWVRDDPVLRRDVPQRRDLYLPAPNREVARLAREVAGAARGAYERAEAVQSYLSTTYTYSLDSAGVDRSDPVAWFLFTGRRGHCEFFAGAMVVMLRHLGVPARLVAGYNGGALGPGGDTATVRQSNAHAWVEAWLGDERGWGSFDPTPAVGVPALEGRSGLDRVRWAWEQVKDGWDRYILTFGSGEQMGLLSAASDLLSRVRAALRPRHLLVPLSVAALWLAWRLRRSRFAEGRRRGPRRPPAARRVEWVARRLRATGVEVPVQATVRWIGAAAARRWPGAAGEIDELVRRAEGELYTPRPSATPAREMRALNLRLRRAMAAARDVSPAKG